VSNLVERLIVDQKLSEPLKGRNWLEPVSSCSQQDAVGSNASLSLEKKGYRTQRNYNTQKIG